MFGRKVTIKNNRETTTESMLQPESNPWQEAMAGIKPFDKHTAELAAEAEQSQPEISVELLNDINKLSAQLEKMGANPAIVRNPAFSRIMQDSEGYRNLKRSLEVGRKAELQDNQLNFTGLIDRGGSDSELGTA